MSIRELLGEELFNQVSAKLGENKIDIVSNGNWIPKEKFDSLNEDKKAYKLQVETLNTELGKLQKNVKENETAVKDIETLKKTIADNEIKIQKIQKESAVKLAIKDAKAKDADIISMLVDKDKIEILEDGTIKGLEDQLNKLKETKGYLFDEETPGGTGGSAGNHPRPNNNPVKNPWSKEHFNLTEQGRLIKENPELAKQMMANK